MNEDVGEVALILNNDVDEVASVDEGVGEAALLGGRWYRRSGYEVVDEGVDEATPVGWIMVLTDLRSCTRASVKQL